MISARRLDPNFTWRGTGVSRLEGFCDAVFAIVLALLFLRSAPPETYGDLRAAMKSLVPFALCFAIIAYVWAEHWLFSRRYDLQDGRTTFLNLLLLFLLLFYAYPLKFLFTLVSITFFGPIGTQTTAKMIEGMQGAGDAANLFVFYGVGYGAIFFTLAAMYGRARTLAPSLHLDAKELLLTRSGQQQALVHVAVALASVCLALLHVGLNVGAPGWIYGSIGPLMWWHGRWEARSLQKLARAPNTAP